MVPSLQLAEGFASLTGLQSAYPQAKMLFRSTRGAFLDMSFEEVRKFHNPVILRGAIALCTSHPLFRMDLIELLCMISDLGNIPRFVSLIFCLAASQNFSFSIACVCLHV